MRRVTNKELRIRSLTVAAPIRAARVSERMQAVTLCGAEVAAGGRAASKSRPSTRTCHLAAVHGSASAGRMVPSACAWSGAHFVRRVTNKELRIRSLTVAAPIRAARVSKRKQAVISCGAEVAAGGPAVSKSRPSTRTCHLAAVHGSASAGRMVPSACAWSGAHFVRRVTNKELRIRSLTVAAPIRAARVSERMQAATLSGAEVATGGPAVSKSRPSTRTCHLAAVHGSASAGRMVPSACAWSGAHFVRRVTNKELRIRSLTVAAPIRAARVSKRKQAVISCGAEVAAGGWAALKNRPSTRTCHLARGAARISCGVSRIKIKSCAFAP